MNSAITDNITEFVNFPTWIPDFECPSPALFIFFLSSGASIWSTKTFPPLGNFGHVFISFSIGFPSNSKGDAPFYYTVYDDSHAD